MQELNIRTIISALLGKIKWIILSTVVLALAFGIYAKFFVQSTYRSEVQMYVSNYTDVTTAPNASTSGLSASQLLVNEYIVILRHDDITTKVAAYIQEQGNGFVITNAVIKRAVAMSSINETAMLRITATTTSPELSKAICDAYAAVAPAQLKKIMEMGTIKPMGSEAKLGGKVGPNVTKIAMMGGAIGFALACAIVLIFRALDNTVFSERDLKCRLNVTTLGEVPSIQMNKKDDNTITENKSKTSGKTSYTNRNVAFRVAEAYKMIRTNLLFTLANSDSKVVVFSSVEPSAGKSTLCSNLAIVMAQTGAKVLLLDADMRKPVQHRNFRVSKSLGLSKILGNLNTLEECIQHNVVPNLDLIPSGSIPPNPSELLGSERMKKMLDKAEEMYDYIFIDMPPLGVVTDALVVASQAAGVVLVARQKQTTYEGLEECIEEIKQIDARLLGMVVTDVHVATPGYVRYDKRYYRLYNYEYGHQHKSND